MSKRRNRRIKAWGQKLENRRLVAVEKAWDGLPQHISSTELLYKEAMRCVAEGELNKAIQFQNTAAYYSAGVRKRVQTILNIQPEWVWSYSDTCPMILGAMVDVGGCVGTISKITDTQVVVKGVFHYSDGGDGGYAESWAEAFDRAELSKVRFREGAYCNDKNGMHRIWDASELNGSRAS